MRDADLDTWVGSNPTSLQAAYEQLDDALRMLSLADSHWIRGPDEPHAVNRAVAALAAAVGASVRVNLEPACSRLMWATERPRGSAEVLAAAEHYAALGLAAAKRVADREAAECVVTATRFLRTTGGLRAALLSRLVALAQRRLANASALVGAHLPFWRFPYAHRWSTECPRAGRGVLGRVDPIDVDALEGWPLLAYRAGIARAQLAGSLERCAAAARRDGRWVHGGVAELAELSEALSDRWSVPGARSPSDVVTRLLPRALKSPWDTLGAGPSEAVARRLFVPIFAEDFCDLAELAGEHRDHRARVQRFADVA